MTNQYRYGRTKEELVANKLRGLGATVTLSHGSKGAADLVAEWPTGTVWVTQVKATRKHSPASLSSAESKRLKLSGARRKATPVVAKVTGNSVVFTGARKGQSLKPPDTRRR